MKYEEMERLQREIFDGCIQLREAGQKEYAQDLNEAFANFHRGAHAVGIDRKQILWIYLSKHLDGITAAIKGHMSKSEPVYGRIMDAIVYLTLLYGMFLEDEKHEAERAKLAGVQLTLNRPTPISTVEIDPNELRQAAVDHLNDLDPGRVDNLTGHNRPTEDRFGGASPHLGGYVGARRHRLEEDNPNAAPGSSPDPNDWRP